jgi:hypothetical protein
MYAKGETKVLMRIKGMAIFQKIMEKRGGIKRDKKG